MLHEKSMPYYNKDVFKVLMEAIPEGVVIVDSDQKIIEVNSSIEHIFGYSHSYLIHKDLSLLLSLNYPEDHTMRFEIFDSAGKHKKICASTDVYGLKHNGAIFPADVQLNPLSITNQPHVMVLIKDVSEKKEIEKNLMLKSRALQSANNGIVITDALKKDNPIIYYNSAFKKLTGYSSKEILNHNCRFLQGKDKNQKPLKTLRRAIKNGESCQVTIRNYKKDGTLFWNDLYIMPIIDLNGIVTNFIGIQNDVTLRKIAESEKHHFSTIFDESLNEIYVFDADTLKFLNVNYGAQKNIGYSMQELIKMTPLDIKPRNMESKFKDTIEALLKKTVKKIEFETIHKRKDGTTYPVEVHLQLSNLADRDVFVAIILDITERKNYTNKLENKVEERTQQLKIALSKEIELNELKTKFLSLVSHEFKTPLSGILTSSLLLGKYPLTEQQDKRDKHIKTISEKVHYLNNILNDFLSIEKLETGKMNYKFCDFKVSKVVNEVVYNANMILKEGQQIHYPEDIDELSLYQDEKTIELILSNLVYNAVRYSHEHGIIALEIFQNTKTTTFKIIDYGIGIPKKDHSRIFDRYFRAENVTNTQGTGIGLNIVKSHLDQLKGTINFTSNEHIGTTFTVVIPNKANQ
ncbi:PAS domain S-box protein [Mariniflexile ostreae]|uniref:histidine kinase n=1 Tax=Mariniflexile ostreae TaxID=1520892 RepID=A0ABV5F9I0_9FLAO